MNNWPTDESLALPNISLLERQIRDFQPSEYVFIQKGYCSQKEYANMRSKHHQKIPPIIEASLLAHISYHTFRDFQETTQRVKEWVHKHSGIYFHEGSEHQQRFYALSSPVAPDFLGELVQYHGIKSVSKEEGVPVERTATLNLLLSPRLVDGLDDSLLPVLKHISSITFPNEKTQFFNYNSQLLSKITDYKRSA